MDSFKIVCNKCGSDEYVLIFDGAEQWEYDTHYGFLGRDDPHYKNFVESFNFFNHYGLSITCKKCGNHNHGDYVGEEADRVFKEINKKELMYKLLGV